MLTSRTQSNNPSEVRGHNNSNNVPKTSPILLGSSRGAACSFARPRVEASGDEESGGFACCGHTAEMG